MASRSLTDTDPAPADSDLRLFRDRCTDGPHRTSTSVHRWTH